MARIQGQVDIPLNAKGRYQGRMASAFFSGIPIGQCISSPFSRAYDTARLILAGRTVNIRTDDRLKEISYGIGEGQDLNRIYVDETLTLHSYFFAPECYIPPTNGESIPQLLDRCRSFLELLESQEENLPDHLLVTTHGAWIQGMILVVDHRPVSDFWKGKKQENCAVTILKWEEKRWWLEAEAVSLAEKDSICE